MKKTSKPGKWPKRKIKKHQNLHFLFKTLCKKRQFSKKNYFSKKDVHFKKNNSIQNFTSKIFKN